jgi:hypothetical protein
MHTCTLYLGPCVPRPRHVTHARFLAPRPQLRAVAAREARLGDDYWVLREREGGEREGRKEERERKGRKEERERERARERARERERRKKERERERATCVR